jgi:O-antigen ligase
LQASGLLFVSFATFFPPLFHLQEYLFLMLFVVALVAVAGVKGLSPLVRSSIDVPLLSFIGWVLWTVPFATDIGYSFAEWRKLATHALVYYWALLVMRHSGRRLAQQILWATILGCAFLSAYALSDFVLRGGSWQSRAIRARAPGSDYNWLSTYMVLALPIVISYVVVTSFKGLRVAAGVTILLSMVSQAASYTRAGWLGHAVQGFAFGILTAPRRLLLWLPVSGAAVGLSILFLSLSGYQKDTLNPWTFDSRVSVWKMGLREVAEHPLVGIGYGNNSFIKRHPQYAVAEQEHLPEEKRVLPAMHNAFLMVMLGTGLPGFAIFVWLFVTIVRELIRKPAIQETHKALVLAWGVAIAVIGFGVRNVFDYMFMGSLSHLFWLLVAAGIVLRNPAMAGDRVGGEDGLGTSSENDKP